MYKIVILEFCGGGEGKEEVEHYECLHKDVPAESEIVDLEVEEVANLLRYLGLKGVVVGALPFISECFRFVPVADGAGAEVDVGMVLKHERVRLRPSLN